MSNRATNGNGAGHGVRVLRTLHALLVLAYGVVACLPQLKAQLPLTVSAGLSIGAYLTTTALLTHRALRTPEARRSWGFVAVGFAAYTAGSTYTWVATWNGSPLGFPSLADVGWLAAYPFVYLGIFRFIRISTASGLTLLDGAIAGVGGAAIFSTVVVDLLAGGVHADGLAGVLTLAYPFADALMAGTLCCQIAVGTWKGRRDLIVFTAGIVALTVADTSYVLRGSYQPGSSVDLGYAVALGVIGCSTWLGSVGEHNPARPTLVRAGLAASSAAGALLVLLAASRIELSTPTVGLAGTTLVLVLARFRWSFRELTVVGEARQREARRDPLTGLANRRGFAEYFDDLRASPADRTVVGLLLDLDRFKQVNDSFGHQAGDELLRQAADRLREVTRDGDLLARLGGDEFVIVCASRGFADDAVVALAERVRVSLRRPFDIAGVPIEIDVSIGIASADGDAVSAEVLLRHADIAMYCAKRAGGGHAFYRANDDEAARRHLQLAQDLRRDVAGPAMVLHYQPKLDLQTDAVSAVEALVRWQHPVHGLLYPDAFLPIVDEIGAMPELTHNVLVQAMDQCVAWRRANLKLSVAVNVSAADLESAGFTDLVVGILRDRGLPATALTLEITETTAMENSEPAHHTVRELHSLGIKVSIDDYGTDHSTLAHLHRLLVAGELKLDRRFVMHLETEERASAIVRSSIQLAHALGMAVVAEGVENAGSLDMLRQWGCDTAQGYFISRPQTAGDVTAWLTRPAASREYGMTRSS
ncbi:putative bifunctional diguanylate cyclase/phosphodiesterase [Cryptosporangium arvum]|uniref:putative bifunctional diguanylate cyclase/phosphodiesterase n=1 Tax=Cryptosporangium arvum TaxID=80871 RepID=UPI0004B49CAF|nr:EAL domain-containing protein [Cryptosporangium arvum]